MEFSQPSTSTASQSFEMNTSGRQTEEEQTSRIALKFNYMSLLDEANEIVGNQNVRESLVQINTVIDKAAQMFPLVKDTTAMFMDAKVFHCTTTTLEQATDNIDVGEGVFKLFPFAEQFKMKSRNSEGKPSWEVLAEVAPPVVQNPLPYWTPLLGSFEYSVEVEASQQKRVRQQRQKDEIAEKKEPTKDPRGENSQEGVEKMVQRVYEKLKKHYRRRRKPIHYFRFVVNPTSFSDTVENIFHVSFLINDGHAQIEIIDGHPMISPIEDKENANPSDTASQATERKQMIVPMDMDLWEAFVNVLDIKTAMI